MEVKVLVAQSCPTLCDPTDCSPPGSSVHRILKAKILEWVSIPFSRGFSPTRDRTRVSHIVGRRSAVWATRESLLSPVAPRRQVLPTPQVSLEPRPPPSGPPVGSRPAVTWVTSCWDWAEAPLSHACVPDPQKWSFFSTKLVVIATQRWKTNALTATPPQEKTSSIITICCCSVPKSCPTLRDPLDCYMYACVFLHEVAK